MKPTKKPSKKGFAQIPNILFRTEALSPMAKLVLGYLYTFGKRIYPKQETIAKEVGISKPTVNKAVKELVSVNALQYVKGSGRSKKANEYTIRHVSDWRLEVQRPKRMSKPALLVNEAVRVNDVSTMSKPALLTSVNDVASINTQQEYLSINTEPEMTPHQLAHQALKRYRAFGEVPEGYDGAFWDTTEAEFKAGLLEFFERRAARDVP